MTFTKKRVIIALTSATGAVLYAAADRKTLWGTEILPALYRIPPIRYNATRKEIIARITGRRNRVKTYIIIAVRIRTHRRQLRT